MNNMESKEHKIRVHRTAHYYTLGEDVNSAKHIWIVFHGYGQLASRIIQKFNHLDLSKHFVIAIEGLSKFYWSRNPTTVGASWMTKAHRLDEIDDYIAYFDQVLSPYLDAIKENQKLNTLGFSQGSATMFRWIANRKPSLYRIINWAGEYPTELDYKALNTYLSEVDINLYCYGNKDEFITSSNKEKLLDFVHQNNLDVEFHEFDGKHEINRRLLQQIAEPNIIA